MKSCLLLHRVLHHPLLYKHIHKKHHEWSTPIGLVADYAHPVEHVISNIIPMYTGGWGISQHEVWKRSLNEHHWLRLSRIIFQCCVVSDIYNMKISIDLMSNLTNFNLGSMYIHTEYEPLFPRWPLNFAFNEEWIFPLGKLILPDVFEDGILFILGPLLMGSHLLLMWVWFALALINTYISHSGYHLPLLPSPQMHDYHHLKWVRFFRVNVTT